MTTDEKGVSLQYHLVISFAKVNFILSMNYLNFLKLLLITEVVDIGPGGAGM